jgi:hypothetical protein
VNPESTAQPQKEGERKEGARRRRGGHNRRRRGGNRPDAPQAEAPKAE